ncbi:hypothetical protein [Nakamurella sp. PAMC28650]|jgi:hypothetical protein|uniref:hypothetical protein n=1 Tax=Nakamurella sp. PAMC28650 TaxID=2762325 RepID=UPI00164D1CC9|nr:hypothetical protein [Nakamurella sp. PAMC28650]QNK82354.1 hypothetical protein H7F38_06340 [Nakamurella sp. PAMC28650]
MTALNTTLTAKIERHLFDVSRLSSRTFGPAIATSEPGRNEITLSTAAAVVCAQIEVMMERRFAVFRASAEDLTLLGHVRSAEAALRQVAVLIGARASTEALHDELEIVFDHLTAAITMTSLLRQPAHR